jgi:hypothetical protein
MTPAKLATMAAQAHVAKGALVLVIKKGQYPKGFPKSELLNEHLEHGKPFRTYRFNPSTVLKWALKSGTVAMEQVDGGIAFRDLEPPGQTTRENEG